MPAGSLDDSGGEQGDKELPEFQGLFENEPVVGGMHVRRENYFGSRCERWVM